MKHLLIPPDNIICKHTRDKALGGKYAFERFWVSCESHFGANIFLFDLRTPSWCSCVTKPMANNIHYLSACLANKDTFDCIKLGGRFTEPSPSQRVAFCSYIP